MQGAAVPAWIPSPSGVSTLPESKDAPEAVSVASQAPTTFHYFKSEVLPQVGDRIATGSFGECKVVSITTAWELECRNIMTGEIGHCFANDCDLISRPESTSPSPASPLSVPTPDTLLVGDYRRDIGIDLETPLTFEAGETVTLRTTVEEVLTLPTLKADVARLEAALEESRSRFEYILELIPDAKDRMGSIKETAERGKENATLSLAKGDKEGAR